MFSSWIWKGHETYVICQHDAVNLFHIVSKFWMKLHIWNHSHLFLQLSSFSFILQYITLKIYYFDYMCMGVFPTSLCVVPSVASKERSEALVMDLQRVVSHHVNAGKQALVFCESHKTLNCCTISPALVHVLLSCCVFFSSWELALEKRKLKARKRRVRPV